MNNRYNVLKCDLDDPKSIEAVGQFVKERALKGACSYFELETALSVRLVVECNPAFGAKVQVMDDEGVSAEVMSSNGVNNHRYLKVERSVEGMAKGALAHKILAIINAVEEQIPEENVRGYDMIIFYIREGYVPDEPKFETSLINELVVFLKRKKARQGSITGMERIMLPLVNLKFNPDAAKSYWEKLLELSR